MAAPFITEGDIGLHTGENLVIYIWTARVAHLPTIFNDSGQNVVLLRSQP